jgi:hypothetical protein
MRLFTQRMPDESVDDERSPRTSENGLLVELRRLYAKRDAVDALIRSVEAYERVRRPPVRCGRFSEGERKCS